MGKINTVLLLYIYIYIKNLTNSSSVKNKMKGFMHSQKEKTRNNRLTPLLGYICIYIKQVSVR